MIDHPFKVGGRYRNEKGEYEVLVVDGERMRVRYDDGTKQSVKVEIQARIWRRIQDEAKPKPPPRRSDLNDNGLDTQPVGDLVQTVLKSNFSYPYPEDVTDQVCLAIESNSDWLSRYHNLVEHFSSLGKNGKLTVNSSIGWFVKRYSGMNNIGEGATAKSSLIQSYSRLGPSKTG